MNRVDVSYQLASLIIFLKDANRGHPLPDTQPANSLLQPGCLASDKEHLGFFNPLPLRLRLSFVRGFKQMGFFSGCFFFLWEKGEGGGEK